MPGTTLVKSELSIPLTRQTAFLDSPRGEQDCFLYRPDNANRFLCGDVFRVVFSYTSEKLRFDFVITVTAIIEIKHHCQSFQHGCLTTAMTKSISVPFALVLCLVVLCSRAHADYSETEAGKKFIAEMVVEHNLNSADVTAMLRKAKRNDRVLELISKPAEKRLEWKGYRKIFLTDERIDAGVTFWLENEAILSKAEQEYGVPASVIVAIIGVETFYGRIGGGFRALDALSTLAFEYPPRARFFRSELAQLFLLAEEEKLNMDELEGSYAGAFGMPQFISSSYRQYAIDFDGDNQNDLWQSIPDVVGSVANYFKRHGWKSDQAVIEKVEITDAAKNLIVDSPKPVTTLASLENAGIYPKRKGTGKYSLLKFESDTGTEHWLAHHNFYVITRYNHSNLYAMAVHQLSQKIKSRKESR